MIILRLALLFGVPFILGAALLALILNKKCSDYSPIERLSLTLPLGFGSLAILMYFSCRLGVPLTLANCSAAAICAALVFIGVAWVLGWRTQFHGKLGIIKLHLTVAEKVLLASLMALFAYVFTVSIGKPLVDVDAFQFYSIVAKGILYKASFLSAYLQPYLNDKPVFPYLYQGWSFLVLGTPNDALFKVANPILFLCFITAFYSVIRRFLSRTHSLLFALLLASLPLTLYHVSTAYADFPITLFFGLACFYFYRCLEEFESGSSGANPSLSLALTFLSFTIWTKRAGLVLALIMLSMLAVFLILRRQQLIKKDPRLILAAFWPFVLFALPWIALSQKGTLSRVAGSALGADTASAASQQLASPDLVVMLGIITNKILFYGDWLLLMGLFIVCLIFFWTVARKPALNYLLALILLCLFVITYQFHSKEMYQWLLDGTLLDRLIMNVTPAILLFSAASFAAASATQAAKDNRPANAKHAFSKK